MGRFENEADAAEHGFHIEHEPDRQRFALYHRDAATDENEASDSLIGEAHYSLLGTDVIDFDHTVVSPDYRGTGLSGLLAHHAVTSNVTHGRTIAASCWFIEGYLAKHPELATQPHGE